MGKGHVKRRYFILLFLLGLTAWGISNIYYGSTGLTKVEQYAVDGNWFIPEKFNTTLSEEGYTITGFDTFDEDFINYAVRNNYNIAVDIPAEYDGPEGRYNVVGVAPYAFSAGATGVDDYEYYAAGVDLSRAVNLKSIGDYAFRNTTIENELDLSNVEYIGEGAFQGALDIRGLTLPTNANYTAISNSCFARTTMDITSLTIPSNITKIGTAAFSDIYFYTTKPTLVLNDNITTIESYAFRTGTYESLYLGFGGTLNLPINSSYTTISEECFKGNKFDNIIIPNNVTTVGDLALYSCTDAGAGDGINLDLPDNLQVVGIRAFANNFFSGALVIPDTVLLVDHEAFYVDSSTRNIRRWMDESLSRGLRAIYLPDSDATYGNNVFLDSFGFIIAPSLSRYQILNESSHINNENYSSFFTYQYSVEYVRGTATGEYEGRTDTKLWGNSLAYVKDNVSLLWNEYSSYGFPSIAPETGYFVGYGLSNTTDANDVKADSYWIAPSSYDIELDVITYYANRCLGTYIVTLHENGGSYSNEYSEPTDYSYNSGLLLPTADEIIKTGCSFDGWYDNAEFDGTSITNILDTDYGEKEYYAKWSLIEYDIIYNVNLGSYAEGYSAPDKYFYEETTILPTSAFITRAGYDFGGWYLNSELSGEQITEVNDSDTGNKEYYAKWIARDDTPYMVYHYFENNEGTYVVQNPTYDVLNRVGTTDESVSDLYQVRTGYVANEEHDDKVTSGTLAGDGSLVLKFYYDLDTYTYTYNGGTSTSGAVPEDGTAKYLNEYTVSTLCNLEKAGYTHIGWTINGESIDGTGKVEKLNRWSNTTLYPVWEPDTYEILYNNGDDESGALTFSPSTKIHDVTFSDFVDCTLSQTGYIQVGWTNNGDDSYDSNDVMTEYTLNEDVTLYPVWTRTYSISYNNGDDTSGASTFSSSTKIHDVEFRDFVDCTLSQTEYIQVGWTKKGTDSYRMEDIMTRYITNADITLYPVWKLRTYDVIYDTCGNPGVRPSNDSKVYGTPFEVPSSGGLIKDGYTHIGWKTGGESLDGGGMITIYEGNADVTLYPVWQIKTYDIDYDAGTGTGDLPDNGVKTHGQTYSISASHPLSKEGYTQIGWKTGGESLDGRGRITTYEGNANVTLYPVWQIITYDVDYDAGTGTGSLPENGVKTHGQIYNIPALYPLSKEGYTQIGWKTGGESLVGTEKITTYEGNANVTLYPVWQIKTYDVDYDAGTGTGSLPADGVKTHGQTYNIPASYPLSKEGYTQIGWKTGGESLVVAEKITTYEGNANVTLYPVWQIITYDVDYDAGTGTGSLPADGVKTHGQIYNIPALYPLSKEGYTQIGWKTGGESLVVAEKITTYEGNANVTLYPVWEANSYGIVLNENFGSYSLGYEEPASYTFGNALTLPTSTNIMRDNYLFIGWYDNEDLEGLPVTDILATDYGAKEYYAKWEIIKYNVIYVENGGNYLPDGVYSKTIGLTLPNSTIISREGYAFAGWYDNEELEGTAITSIPATESGNKEFHAKWVLISNADYKIEHYFEDLSSTFVIDNSKTQTLSDSVAKSVNAAYLTGASLPIGFEADTDNANKVESGLIIQDGTLVLRLYYTRTLHTITWKNGNNVLEIDSNVKYGETPSYDGSIPTKPNLGDYKYEFSGWLPATTTVTGTAIYVAEFTSSLIKIASVIDPVNEEDIAATISSEDGFTETATLVVKVVATEAVSSNLSLPVGKGIVKAYNATLYVDDVESNPTYNVDNTYTIKFARPVGMLEIDNYRIIMKENGATVEKNITVSGDYLEFSTAVLGDFMIVSDEQADISVVVIILTVLCALECAAVVFLARAYSSSRTKRLNSISGLGLILAASIPTWQIVMSVILGVVVVVLAAVIVILALKIKKQKSNVPIEK